MVFLYYVKLWYSENTNFSSSRYHLLETGSRHTYGFQFTGVSNIWVYVMNRKSSTSLAIWWEGVRVWIRVRACARCVMDLFCCVLFYSNCGISEFRNVWIHVIDLSRYAIVYSASPCEETAELLPAPQYNESYGSLRDVFYGNFRIRIKICK